MPDFFVGARDSNSDSPEGTASALPIEHLLIPMKIHFDNYRSSNLFKHDTKFQRDDGGGMGREGHTEWGGWGKGSSLRTKSFFMETLPHLTPSSFLSPTLPSALPLSLPLLSPLPSLPSFSPPSLPLPPPCPSSLAICWVDLAHARHIL